MFTDILAVSGSTSLIKTFLDQYFDHIVYAPSFWKNYNLAIKVPLTLNQCSALEDFYRGKMITNSLVTARRYLSLIKRQFFRVFIKRVTKSRILATR